MTAQQATTHDVQLESYAKAHPEQFTPEKIDDLAQLRRMMEKVTCAEHKAEPHFPVYYIAVHGRARPHGYVRQHAVQTYLCA